MTDPNCPDCTTPINDCPPTVGYKHLRGQMLRDAATWADAKGTAIEAAVLEEWNRMYGSNPDE